MVTRILFDPRRDLTDGTTSSSAVTLEATPTGVREDGSVVVLPSTLSFTVNTAADLVQLAAPAASWAWRLVARQDGVVKQQRTVRFTDVTSVKWAELVDVDPATLGETDGHARQWDATFFQLVELIAGKADTSTLALYLTRAEWAGNVTTATDPDGATVLVVDNSVPGASVTSDPDGSAVLLIGA